MPAKRNKGPQRIEELLQDPSVPMDNRLQLWWHVCSQPMNPVCRDIAQTVLEAAAAGGADEQVALKQQQLNELLTEMQNGPKRLGTFVRIVSNGSTGPRARVLLQDGTAVVTAVPDAELAKSLRIGDTVYLEAQGMAVLGRDDAEFATGEEARLERRLDPQRVLVSLHDHDRHVYLCAEKLSEKLDSHKAVPGCTLLVCARLQMAFDVVPQADGHAHYRYLIQDQVPDIIVERDIGCPPRFLADVTEHVRMEMRQPEVGRRYRLRRCQLKLLAGVSGSGKTLSVLGAWRRMYEVMSQVTGVPLAELPPEVLRLRMSQVLSKWIGDSDKQLDRFFDEVEQLADERFEAPDGKIHELPVLVICEEADALARIRGQDAIFDRIQTTLLQRLDTTCQKLKDRLVILLFTTNVPYLIDPAFLRRAAGTIEKFGRLSERGFREVLAKCLRDLPFRDDLDARRVTDDLAAWLFEPGQDPGLVELTYLGVATPVVKYAGDFMTGAVVDRAVQQAAAEACRAECAGTDRPGLTTERLMRALAGQVRSIADQLHVYNVGEYCTLPDSVRVASLRRIEQPALPPSDPERTSWKHEPGEEIASGSGGLSPQQA